MSKRKRETEHELQQYGASPEKIGAALFDRIPLTLGESASTTPRSSTCSPPVCLETLENAKIPHVNRENDHTPGNESRGAVRESTSHVITDAQIRMAELSDVKNKKRAILHEISMMKSDQAREEKALAVLLKQVAMAQRGVEAKVERLRHLTESQDQAAAKLRALEDQLEQLISDHMSVVKLEPTS